MNAQLRFFVDGIEQTPRGAALPSRFSRGDHISLAGQQVRIVDVVHRVADDRFTVDVLASAADEADAPEVVLDDLLRYHVLVRVFDGDVSRWLEFLSTEASPAQVEADGPFVERLTRDLCRDPSLLDRIRELVETSTELLFGFSSEECAPVGRQTAAN